MYLSLPLRKMQIIDCVTNGVNRDRGVELDMAQIRKLLRARKILGESVADSGPVSLATR